MITTPIKPGGRISFPRSPHHCLPMSHTCPWVSPQQTLLTINDVVQLLPGISHVYFHFQWYNTLDSLTQKVCTNGDCVCVDVALYMKRDCMQDPWRQILFCRQQMKSDKFMKCRIIMQKNVSEDVLADPEVMKKTLIMLVKLITVHSMDKYKQNRENLRKAA